MSSSFVNSHQHVGLNRVGRFYKTVPEKGPSNCRQDAGDTAGETPALRNEPWRRWTGMVGADEHRLTWKQRKRGIRRLLKQIERRLCQIGPQLGATRLDVETGAFAERMRKRPKALDIFPTELNHWARTQSGGRTLESICNEFGISRKQLSSLTREYNSMSAAEVLDGFKIRGLRKFLVAQLREAAFHLWGPPGDFAQRRCMVCHGQPAVGCPCEAGEGVGTLRHRREVARATSANSRRRCPWHTHRGPENAAPYYSKRSRYFRTQPWEFFGVLPGDEERLRVSELLGKLDALRDEHDWRVDNLAIQLGFENAGRLKRTCLNVTGRTLEQIERIYACEIVEFYLAAEDRELRRIALMDPIGHMGPMVYAAREIYCGDAEIIPEEPFLDRWSAAEFARPEWIEAMRKEFG